LLKNSGITGAIIGTAQSLLSGWQIVAVISLVTIILIGF